MSDAPFHQARWNEPIVMELGEAGERGIFPAAVEDELAERAGDVTSLLPEGVGRTQPPALPELSQPVVRKHFLRLSQETVGAAVGVDIGQGTATMKYSPPVNDQLAQAVAELHPLQPASSVQGVLSILHSFEEILRQLSGLARFSFQPGGGTHGIYANACIVRAYHAERGESEQRDEILTTIYSHPSDAAAPATAGYRIITLEPGPNGYPDAQSVRNAVSERTAGFFVANPEDTGLYNPEIAELAAIVHGVGGLAVYDQANANGLLSLVRAKEAGFDLCQYNLHKTFGSPHGCGGLACGAIGASAELAKFLPQPLVERDDDGRFYLETGRPESIGNVRAFHGIVDTVLRSYAWVLAHGLEGLREVAETAVMNNNYLAQRLAELDGVELSYGDTNGTARIEQVRYSLAGVEAETGVDTEAISRRTADYGVASYFPSHKPWTIGEPMTLEPTESPSLRELDDYLAILETVIDEARTDPERVRAAPERCAMHRIEKGALDDPDRWALTWRAHQRKHGR